MKAAAKRSIDEAMLSMAECFRPLLRLTDSDCPSSAAERFRKGRVNDGSSIITAETAAATAGVDVTAERDGRRAGMVVPATMPSATVLLELVDIVMSF